jgi:hypothetical protein
MRLYQVHRCLNYTREFDFKDFDFPFALEAMARAYAVLNRKGILLFLHHKIQN